MIDREREIRERHARLVSAVRELDRWCDEQRNAPRMTTLGMVQEKLRALVPDPEKE